MRCPWVAGILKRPFSPHLLLGRGWLTSYLDYSQGFEEFHPLQFPGEWMISSGPSSLCCPCQAGLRTYHGLPSSEAQDYEGARGRGGSNLSRCVWGAWTFALPSDHHLELSAATPGAPAPLGAGEALTSGLPSAGTGD